VSDVKAHVVTEIDVLSFKDWRPSDYVTVVVSLVALLYATGWMARDSLLLFMGAEYVSTPREVCVEAGALYLVSLVPGLSAIYDFFWWRRGAARPFRHVSVGFIFGLAALVGFFITLIGSAGRGSEGVDLHFALHLGSNVGFEGVIALMGICVGGFSPLPEIDVDSKQFFKVISVSMLTLLLFVFAVVFGVIVLPSAPAWLGGIDRQFSIVQLKDPNEVAVGRILGVDEHFIVLGPLYAGNDLQHLSKRNIAAATITTSRVAGIYPCDPTFQQSIESPKESTPKR
jgi:hypothetical protein